MANKKSNTENSGIKVGDKISIEYEGKFDNGEVFDSSTHGEHSHPLEFEVGSGQVIKGFEEAVVGMEKGEEKEFSVEPDKGYGKRDEELVKELPRNALPEDPKPKEGMFLQLGTEGGQMFPAVITSVSESKVKIDLNHPLARKKLNFKIKIVGVKVNS